MKVRVSVAEERVVALLVRVNVGTTFVRSLLGREVGTDDGWEDGFADGCLLGWLVGCEEGTGVSTVTTLAAPKEGAAILTSETRSPASDRKAAVTAPDVTFLA